MFNSNKLHLLPLYQLLLLRVFIDKPGKILKNPLHLKETLSSSEEQFGRKVSLQIPPQLLPILSSHIIQEAANEPYGLKGESFQIQKRGFK